MLSDLCVRTDDFPRAIDLAGRLGLAMVGLIAPIEDLPGIEKLRDSRDWRKKPAVALGTEVVAAKPGQVPNMVYSVRTKVEIVVARGGTEEINRAILETPEVDILIGHDIQGRTGINHVTARLAKKNNVAIGFDMNSLMTSYRLGRIQEFAAMTDTAKLVRRFGSPFVLTSGAMELWDMRSPSELVAMGKQLGFSEAQARKGLSEGIVRENKKRLSRKWIMPGVEVE